VPAARLLERFDPADRAALDAALTRARRLAEPAQCAVRLRGCADGPPRWVELRAQAMACAHGITWHGVIADITERRQAEEQQQSLLREVDHRAKNTLAVVQALLRLTRTEDPAEILPRVEARIGALARAHTLLAQSRWRGAGLHRLAAAEISRLRCGEACVPADIAGPPVMLSPIATQPVAMVLHEPALAWRFCDRVVLIHGDGHTETGPAREMLSIERLSALYQYPLHAIECDGRISFIPR
jgi:PAS domain-containing protein